jgi:hypothetical protein
MQTANRFNSIEIQLFRQEFKKRLFCFEIKQSGLFGIPAYRLIITLYFKVHYSEPIPPAYHYLFPVLKIRPLAYK